MWRGTLDDFDPSAWAAVNAETLLNGQTAQDEDAMTINFPFKLFQVLPLLLAGLLAGERALAIDAEADRILREMGDYLKGAEEFSFRAEISYDAMFTTGEKVRYGSHSDISIRRPNRLLVAANGDEHRRRVFYDGGKLTLYDVQKNLYAVTEVPNQIDGALDSVFEKFGLTVPLADFAYADPYAVLTEHAEYGQVVGVHGCGDKRCHHLLFTQDAIDWQIWIETGARPVPRKLVITYKTEPGSPQYEARLSGWDFNPRLSDHAFTFHPPEGSSEIEFLPGSVEETQE